MLSGLLSLAVLSRLVQISGGLAITLTVRLYAPFVAACALLIALSLWLNGIETVQGALSIASVETAAALALFTFYRTYRAGPLI